MARRIVVICVCIGALICAAVIALRFAFTPPILMYHSVDHTADRSNKLTVSPESFERQMAFLSRHRYSVIPLEEMVGRIRRKERIPLKTVAITFDDGIRSNFTYAYPILKRYGFPATIFVITNFVGQGDNYLDWDQLREMAASGLISIGSHTKTQRWLTSLGDAELMDELVGSREAIRRNLGAVSGVFSYPMGNFTEREKDAVRRAGYSAAVATNPGMHSPADDIYALKRQRISNTSDNLAVFWFETSGLYTWIKEHRDD